MDEHGLLEKFYKNEGFEVVGFAHEFQWPRRGDFRPQNPVLATVRKMATGGHETVSEVKPLD